MNEIPAIMALQVVLVGEFQFLNHKSKIFSNLLVHVQFQVKKKRAA